MRINSKDMEKLEQEFFRNLYRQPYEYGGIGLDGKRPFGNSDVESDILEIIEASMEGDDGESECWSSKQRAYASELYDNLIPHLKKKYLK